MEGIRIEYSPSGVGRLQSGKESVDLADDMQARGEGFFFARIDEAVADDLAPPLDGKHDLFDLLHNLTIAPPAFPEEFDSSRQEAFCENSSPPEPPVCLDENILVQALILVNTDPR